MKTKKNGAVRALEKNQADQTEYDKLLGEFKDAYRSASSSSSWPVTVRNTAFEENAIKRIAWSDHAFRSGLVGVTDDPAVINLSFMPETIDSVISLPARKAMHRIVQALVSLLGSKT